MDLFISRKHKQASRRWGLNCEIAKIRSEEHDECIVICACLLLLFVDEVDIVGFCDKGLHRKNLWALPETSDGARLLQLSPSIGVYSNTRLPD